MIIRLNGQSSTRAATSVRIEVEGQPGQPTTGLINDQSALFRSVLHSRSGGSIRLTADGEPSDFFSITLEFRPYVRGRMPGVEFVRSPNQGMRPFSAVVDTVVVHATVIPTLEATVDAFLQTSSQVSAHYVVGRDGKIVQMVEDTERAWHAGVSELEGVKGVNDFSVGIEIVNLNDGIDAFTDAQYGAVAAIIRHLRESYDIRDRRIVSHALVARPAGRKSDPAGFDFGRLLKLAR